MKARVGRSVFTEPSLVIEDKFSDIEDKTLHYNFNAALHRDETPIVIDTGASFSLTPFKEDLWRDRRNKHGRPTTHAVH